MKYQNHRFAWVTIVMVMFAALFSGCHLGPTQHSRHSAIHDFARDGNLALARQDLSTNLSDLNLPDDAGLTPLHLAALHCHTNIVAFLLEEGAKVNLKTRDGATPLHLAAQEGCTEVADLLLRGGAKINLRDDQHRTPLGRAEAWNQQTMIKLLQVHGGTD